jgi:hypothetical protein
MKMFNDSHLEVKKFFKGTFFTHPYEAGWADEAIFFVMVEKIEGDPVFEGRVQLSQDGIHWADDGSEPTIFKGLGQHIIIQILVIIFVLPSALKAERCF